MTDSQLLDKALNFIVETQESNDYICNQMGEWCETNCISTLKSPMCIAVSKRHLSRGAIMKSKIYEFDPVLYPFPIHITKDFDIKELKEKYKVLNASDEEEPITDELDHDDRTTARVINAVDSESGNMCYLVILFRPDVIGAGNAAHESVHLANAYLQYLGFSCPTAYNDEPYAYFVQWVTNCIWSVLVDETDKMKGKLLNG